MKNGIYLALIGFALFATHDAIIKSLGGEVSVIQILFFANLFAFPWVSFMVISDGRAENFRPKRLKFVILRTFTGLLAGACAFYSFMNLPLADVYGLLFTTPILITLLSVPLLGEKLGIFRITAVIFGFIGVLVMIPINPESLELGHITAFLAACLSSINGIITRKIGQTEREAVMIIIPLTITIIVMGALLPLAYDPIELDELGKLALIGSLAFFAQYLIIQAYKRSDAAIIAPMQYSQLLWAVLYGALFFHETPTLRNAIGALIIVASGLLILYREVYGNTSNTRPASTFRNFRPDTQRSWVKSEDSKNYGNE